MTAGCKRCATPAGHRYVAQEHNLFVSSSGGIANMGVTCYANALLQVFLHVPEMREGIAAQATQTSAEQGLRQLLQKIIEQQQLTPEDLEGFIRSLDMEWGKQNDASEVLDKVFLHPSSVEKPVQTELAYSSVSLGVRHSIDAVRLAESPYHALGKQEVLDAVSCQERKVLHFTTRGVGQYRQEENEIFMDVYSCGQQTSLQQAVQEYFAPEYGLGKYVTSSSGEEFKHITCDQAADTPEEDLWVVQKTHHIQGTGRALVLRWHPYLYKGGSVTEGKFLPQGCRSIQLPIGVENAQMASFSLRGCILRTGSNTHCGHYTALVRDEGAWIHYNDASVTRFADASDGSNVPVDKLLKRGAYLFFFVRQQEAGGQMVSSGQPMRLGAYPKVGG